VAMRYTRLLASVSELSSLQKAWGVYHEPGAGYRVRWHVMSERHQVLGIDLSVVVKALNH